MPEPSWGEEAAPRIAGAAGEPIEAFGAFNKKLLADPEWSQLFIAINAAIQENPGTELIYTTLLSEPWLPS